MVGEKKGESRISAFFGTENIRRGEGWRKLVSFFGHVSQGSNGQLDMKERGIDWRSEIGSHQNGHRLQRCKKLSRERGRDELHPQWPLEGIPPSLQNLTMILTSSSCLRSVLAFFLLISFPSRKQTLHPSNSLAHGRGGVSPWPAQACAQSRCPQHIY